MTQRPGRTIRVAAAAVAAGAALLAAAPAEAVDGSVKYAWMRPAAATTSAKVYVEIASDTALDLTGAASPLAKRIDIVRVERPDGTDEGRVVPSLPVSATTPTRLAYLGSHLRFTDLVEDVSNATKVPLTLEFTDRDGTTYQAATYVQVRGILRPQTVASPPDATAPANGGTGAPAVGDVAPASKQ